MGLKVVNEEIAWMEEFGTLDQPIASRGATVFTIRSLLWMTIGAILIYEGFGMGGTKIANIVPVKGLLLIIPGALFLLFGIVPSKSVRREIQFLFMIRFIIKRLAKNSKSSGKKQKTKQVVEHKKHHNIKKEKIVKNKKKKKAKPARIVKK